MTKRPFRLPKSPYSDEDKQFIRENAHLTAVQLADLMPGRTSGAVAKQAYWLGVKLARPIRDKPPTDTREPFTISIPRSLRLYITELAPPDGRSRWVEAAIRFYIAHAHTSHTET